MQYNFYKKNILGAAISKCLVACTGFFYGCTSAIAGIGNMQISQITKNYPLYLINPVDIQQEPFNPSNKKHVEILKNKVDKIDVYYEVPGLDCSWDMFEQLNTKLYTAHLHATNIVSRQSACVFIPIQNIDVQNKTIEKQASKINSSADDIRKKFDEEVVKRFKLGENYFDKFRETWIGFSQGGPIAFECWWHVYNKNLAHLKECNYTPKQDEPSHRLVLCNTGLFGCSSLDIADSIIEYIPDETLPPGIKDLSKNRSKKRVAERWMVLKKQNCLLAGSLSNTQEEKKQYVNNMLYPIGIDFVSFPIQGLIIPFLPKGDCCFSAEDQLPKRLREKGIKAVFLEGHHVESLFLDKNTKTLANKIVNWPT